MKTVKKARSRRTRRGSGTQPKETSVPTGRVAYSETRRWLLAQHGPICAYCGLPAEPRTITLDHVAPRRGQSAYDRRDNLVLCCKRCNAAKSDKPFLAYLLGQRGRATNLLRYGAHLSEGILHNVRHLAGEPQPIAADRERIPRVIYGDDEEDSPYLDSPYKASA